MSPTSFEDLDHRQRRRLVLCSAVRIATSAALLSGLHAVMPAAGRSGTRAIAELVSEHEPG